MWPALARLKGISDFHRTIPTPLLPNLPTPDDFTEAILASNDSSPGPDGLPFSVYRVYALEDPELAQTLCDLALDMAGGAPPPEGVQLRPPSPHS